MHDHATLLFLLELPIWGQYKTLQPKWQITIDLLRFPNVRVSKGFVNKSASWSFVPTCSNAMVCSQLALL